MVDFEPQSVWLYGNLIDPASESDSRRGSAHPLQRAPHSYTGEDVIEIHGHGGAFVSQKVLQLVLDQGARLAEPGEFTRRAFTNGRLDLSQAEAVADVIHAASDKALASARRATQGATLRKTQRTLYDALVQVLAQLEAAIDFPEEGLRVHAKTKTRPKYSGDKC